MPGHEKAIPWPECLHAPKHKNVTQSLFVAVRIIFVLNRNEQIAI